MNKVLNNSTSILTHIPEKLLNNISYTQKLIISDIIHEMKLNDEDTCDIDIGIGTLTIKTMENNYKFKFTPDAKLIDIITTDINNDISSLSNLLEVNLANKLVQTYKEFI